MYKFGWIPDLPDIRDKYYKSAKTFKSIFRTFPKVIDLRDKFVPCGDQGDIGSCTAWGSLAGISYLDSKSGKEFGRYSHLFQYYNSRDDKNNDTGATIRDAFKSLNEFGSCTEEKWSYNTRNFTVKPPQECYDEGDDRQLIDYSRVNQNDDLKRVLVEGFPVVFGMTLYDSFMNTPKTGLVMTPNIERESVQGGHCMIIVGYDLDRKVYIVRNSWSTNWGDNGYCYIPMCMIENEDMCCDFWVAKKLES